MTKRCSKCDTVKSVEEFPSRDDGRAGLRAHCKDCKKALDRSSYLRRREGLKEGVAAREPIDQRSALRRAIEESDYEAAYSELKAKTANGDGCWLWHRENKQGYGVVKYHRGGRTVSHLAHRLMYQAYHRTEIAPAQVVHHTCANRLCINPDHLQLIDQHSNVAEMLERNYYLNRIEELEQALAAIAPNHSLLSRAYAA